MLIQQSMYGTNSKNIQVLGQLNHRCGMTSQTRSFRIEQEKTDLQLYLYELFSTLEEVMRLICLTLSVAWNM